MTTTPPDGPNAAPRWKPLDARQRRVLGVLIEKAKTTPAGYPMTVKAIVTGCNQKNNRDPLSAYDDIDVEKALDQLRTLGTVSEIDWMGRVSKYKHHAYEWLGVSKPEIAVMTELLLRGAQALGDLRARASRMEPIADLNALKPVVDALLERGLMVEITPPGRGQVVSHNLYLPEELAEVKAGGSAGAGHAVASGDDDPNAPPSSRSTQPPAGASAEIAALRAEVAELREQVRELETKLMAALG